MKNINIKSIIAWIVVSSENPQAVSLTVKGALLSIVPTLLLLANFQWFQHLTPDLINVIINYVVIFVQDALYAISFSIAGYGIIRKIINTWFIPDADVTTVVTPTVVVSTSSATQAGGQSSAKIVG